MIALIHAVKQFIIAAFHAEVEIAVTFFCQLFYLLYHLVFQIFHAGIPTDRSYRRQVMIDYR